MQIMQKSKKCAIFWKNYTAGKKIHERRSRQISTLPESVSDDLLETKLKFGKYFYTLMHVFLQVETGIFQSCYAYFSPFANRLC